MENKITPHLVGGTLVQTERGYIPIERVQVGDKVLTHRQRFRTVTDVRSALCDDLWIVRGKWFATITCSADFAFYAKARLNGLPQRTPCTELSTSSFIALVPSILEIDKAAIPRRERVRFDSDGIMWYSPTEIEPLENVSAILYTINVEEDNSFTANGIIVLN